MERIYAGRFSNLKRVNSIILKQYRGAQLLVNNPSGMLHASSSGLAEGPTPLGFVKRAVKVRGRSASSLRKRY